ncbi:DUF255 domain-containing protein [Bacteroides sp. AN502(2024)]|uniref:DUF255 domain-containing protein n=1 Tax=Bacteroides sp. AN502(2024) TaxID=3160599 RepID=UPI003512BB25
MRKKNLRGIITVFTILCTVLCGRAQTLSETYGDRFKADVKMNYVRSMDEALRLAKEQNKLVFFNCFADWAVPCHVMNVEVFSNQEFCDYMNRTFVNLIIDMPSAEGKKFAEKYGVYKYACYLILDSEGNVVQRIAGSHMLPEFKEYIDLSLTPKTSLAGTRKKYESGKYSRKDFYNYLRALDAANDSLFAPLAEKYTAEMKPKDYTKPENWLFVFHAIKKKDNALYPYMLANKALFVKSVGEAKVNSMLEYKIYPKILGYTTGDIAYDGEKMAEISREVEQADLPDTCVTRVAHRISLLRGEKKYHDLLQYMEQYGKYLYIYRSNIEMSLKLPDINDADRKELIAYLNKAAEREKESPMGKHLLGLAKQIAGGETGIKFDMLEYQALLDKARKEKKLVFIDCYTVWCGPCRMMSVNVFSRQDVGDYFNDHYVCAKFDMEKGEGPTLAKKYEVSAYPTLLFLDADGNVLKKVVGGLSPWDFLKVARTIAEP